MSAQPDHEIEALEDDQTVPPRPEEIVADAARLTQEVPEPAAPGPAG